MIGVIVRDKIATIRPPTSVRLVEYRVDVLGISARIDDKEIGRPNQIRVRSRPVIRRGWARGSFDAGEITRLLLVE